MEVDSLSYYNRIVSDPWHAQELLVHNQNVIDELEQEYSRVHDLSLHQNILLFRFIMRFSPNEQFVPDFNEPELAAIISSFASCGIESMGAALVALDVIANSCSSSGSSSDIDKDAHAEVLIGLLDETEAYAYHNRDVCGSVFAFPKLEQLTRSLLSNSHSHSHPNVLSVAMRLFRTVCYNAAQAPCDWVMMMLDIVPLTPDTNECVIHEYVMLLTVIGYVNPRVCDGIIHKLARSRCQNIIKDRYDFVKCLKALVYDLSGDEVMRLFQDADVKRLLLWPSRQRGDKELMPRVSSFYGALGYNLSDDDASKLQPIIPSEYQLKGVSHANDKSLPPRHDDDDDSDLHLLTKTLNVRGPLFKFLCPGLSTLHAARPVNDLEYLVVVLYFDYMDDDHANNMPTDVRCVDRRRKKSVTFSVVERWNSCSPAPIKYDTPNDDDWNAAYSLMKRHASRWFDNYTCLTSMTVGVVAGSCVILCGVSSTEYLLDGSRPIPLTMEQRGQYSFNVMTFEDRWSLCCRNNIDRLKSRAYPGCQYAVTAGDVECWGTLGAFAVNEHNVKGFITAGHVLFDYVPDSAYRVDNEAVSVVHEGKLVDGTQLKLLSDNQRFPTILSDSSVNVNVLYMPKSRHSDECHDFAFIRLVDDITEPLVIKTEGVDAVDLEYVLQVGYDNNLTKKNNAEKFYLAMRSGLSEVKCVGWTYVRAVLNSKSVTMPTNAQCMNKNFKNSTHVVLGIKVETSRAVEHGESGALLMMKQTNGVCVPVAMLVACSQRCAVCMPLKPELDRLKLRLRTF